MTSLSTRPPIPPTSSVSQFESDLFSNHCANIVLTLACYEYLFELRHEYECWQRKWTGTTWLFRANRYILLVVSVIGVVPYTPEVRDDTRGLSLPLALTDQRTIILLADVSDSISHVPSSRESDMHNRCTNSGLQIFLHIVVPLPLAIAAAFSALRVFALLNRNYIVGGVVLALGLVPAVVNGYLSSKAYYYYVDDPVLGASCFGNLSLSNFYITRLSRDRRGCRRYRGDYDLDKDIPSFEYSLNVGHAQQLLGSMYFVAMLMCTLAQLLVSTVRAFANAEPLVLILRIMPSILISRFFIHLRKVSNVTSWATDDVMQLGSSGSGLEFRAPPVTFDTTIGLMDGLLDRATGKGLEDGTPRGESRVMDKSQDVIYIYAGR
ncbi:hypothetical protein NM688_g4668 [Phlebia brevispora]|uniref:Uncharacterized protein n=1 Tax=Phlebia brevispora TaxID=194682 RepID=A0ACC1T2W6_9APHY|nr:hypothetical protein NM688_g4668 [Phlebia brevispora]